MSSSSASRVPLALRTGVPTLASPRASLAAASASPAGATLSPKGAAGASPYAAPSLRQSSFGFSMNGAAFAASASSGAASPSGMSSSPLRSARALMSLPENVELGTLKLAYESSLSGMQQLVKQEFDARMRAERQAVQMLQQALDTVQQQLEHEVARSAALNDALVNQENVSVTTAQQYHRQVEALRAELNGMRRVGSLAALHPSQPSSYNEVVMDRSEYEAMLRRVEQAERSADDMRSSVRDLQTTLTATSDKAHSSQFVLSTELERVQNVVRELNKENAQLRVTVGSLKEETSLLQAAVSEGASKDLDIKQLRHELYNSRQEVVRLREELVATQRSAELKIQELAADAGSQRSLVTSMQDALRTARTTLEAESAIHHMHDVQSLSAKIERLETDWREREAEYERRLVDKDALIKTLRQSLQRTNDSYAAAQQRIDMLQREAERLHHNRAGATAASS